MPLRGPPGPGRRAPAPPRFGTPFLRAQNTVVGWDQPSAPLSDGTTGKTGGSGPPSPAPSPTLPRGLGPSCPRSSPHRAHPTASRVAGGQPRFERWALRPSPGVGGPARPRVCPRPQRLPGLRRSPADHRRPDRSSLDPTLPGGRGAAAESPAEGSATAPVRVLRLTSSALGAGEPLRRNAS